MTDDAPEAPKATKAAMPPPPSPDLMKLVEKRLGKLDLRTTTLEKCQTDTNKKEYLSALRLKLKLDRTAQDAVLERRPV